MWVPSNSPHSRAFQLPLRSPSIAARDECVGPRATPTHASKSALASMPSYPLRSSLRSCDGHPALGQSGTLSSPSSQQPISTTSCWLCQIPTLPAGLESADALVLVLAGLRPGRTGAAGSSHTSAEAPAGPNLSSRASRTSPPPLAVQGPPCASGAQKPQKKCDFLPPAVQSRGGVGGLRPLT